MSNSPSYFLSKTRWHLAYARFGFREIDWEGLALFELSNKQRTSATSESRAMFSRSIPTVRRPVVRYPQTTPIKPPEQPQPGPPEHPHTTPCRALDRPHFAPVGNGGRPGFVGPHPHKTPYFFAPRPEAAKRPRHTSAYKRIQMTTGTQGPVADTARRGGLRMRFGICAQKSRQRSVQQSALRRVRTHPSVRAVLTPIYRGPQ